MGWCSSVSLAFIVCYIKKMKVLFGLDFDQVILIKKRHNSNKDSIIIIKLLHARKNQTT